MRKNLCESPIQDWCLQPQVKVVACAAITKNGHSRCRYWHVSTAVVELHLHPTLSLAPLLLVRIGAMNNTANLERIGMLPKLSFFHFFLKQVVVPCAMCHPFDAACIKHVWTTDLAVTL